MDQPVLRVFHFCGPKASYFGQSTQFVTNEDWRFCTGEQCALLLSYIFRKFNISMNYIPGKTASSWFLTQFVSGKNHSQQCQSDNRSVSLFMVQLPFVRMISNQTLWRVFNPCSCITYFSFEFSSSSKIYSSQQSKFERRNLRINLAGNTDPGWKTTNYNAADQGVIPYNFWPR